MSLLRLTKEFTFEMAHALPAYEGKCRNIHGHSYRLLVTVQGDVEQTVGAATEGMVIDFRRLKQIVQENIVDRFDHSLVLPRRGYDAPADSLGGFAANIVWVDFQPTSENLLLHFAALLGDKFPTGAQLHSLKLYETATSCAELIL